MIELQHITKILSQKDRTVTALSGVSLYVPAGKINVIVARENNKNEEKVKNFVKAYQSAEYRQ